MENKKTKYIQKLGEYYDLIKELKNEERREWEEREGLKYFKAWSIKEIKAKAMTKEEAKKEIRRIKNKIRNIQQIQKGIKKDIEETTHEIEKYRRSQTMPLETVPKTYKENEKPKN